MFDEQQDSAPDDFLPELSPEWLTEIERRSAEYDAGLVTTTPWSEVKAEALKRLWADDAR